MVDELGKKPNTGKREVSYIVEFIPILRPFLIYNTTPISLVPEVTSLLCKIVLLLLLQWQIKQLFANFEELLCVIEERVAVYLDIICAPIHAIRTVVNVSVCVSVRTVDIAIGSETIGSEIEIEETQVATSFPKTFFLLSVMPQKFRQRNFEKWCCRDIVRERWQIRKRAIERKHVGQKKLGTSDEIGNTELR